MKIAIRADASAASGSGHIMRCLSLANALAQRGAAVHFLCRDLPQHLSQAITVAGHDLTPLDLSAPPTAAPQEAWPGHYQALDAQACQPLLEQLQPDWLVVDHYGLDRTWETLLRNLTQRLLAIDDLARPHHCDLLLDSGVHQEPATRYATTHQNGARLLLGPTYALLRPEFATLHTQATVREGPVNRLLVCMGGMDATDMTSVALEALDLLEVRPPCVDIVIGVNHPAQARIEAWCTRQPGARLHIQTPDMAMLLAHCDLALGAGGTGTWERSCLGVPTLAVSLALNQSILLDGLAKAGLVYCPDEGAERARVLAVHLQALLANRALRSSISAAGLRCVDGRGTTRLCDAMNHRPLRIRAATADDGENLYHWRNAPSVRKNSRTPTPIDYTAHQRWFTQVLHDPSRHLLLGEDAFGTVGVVRFDVQDTEAEISIYLLENRQGLGFGPRLLAAAEDWLGLNHPGVTMLKAETLAHNRASRHLFEQLGYHLAQQTFTKRIRT